jgi:hypothetical protein
MNVRQLTTEQKDQLVGQTYDGVQYFNPTLDADGNWFISNEEYFNCTTDALFGWLLPEIDHNPVIVNFNEA